jgi:membrane-anchored glycerophosphoryl diester phosphodiesterase (GDPDase)
MTRVSERICGWLGWCPNARILKTLQPGISAPPIENPTILPDGGSSGSGRIGRGKDLAAESMKILVRNRRLLWFSFLILLTFILSIVTDLYIRFFSGTTAFPGVMNSPAILLAQGSLQGVALTSTAVFIENFVFFSLAAGLIICVSQIPLGKSMTIREGLSRAWYHTRPIAGWTIIGALLWIPAGVFAYGFYLITVFALPAIVLDNKDLIAAIRESISIFRKMWVETYVSFGIILLITIGFMLVTLFSLGQVAFASGLINGGILAGMIVSLVVCVLMAIGLVVMGIATCVLYTYEKTGVPLNR